MSILANSIIQRGISGGDLLYPLPDIAGLPLIAISWIKRVGSYNGVLFQVASDGSSSIPPAVTRDVYSYENFDSVYNSWVSQYGSFRTDKIYNQGSLGNSIVAQWQLNIGGSAYLRPNSSKIYNVPRAFFGQNAAYINYNFGSLLDNGFVAIVVAASQNTVQTATHPINFYGTTGLVAFGRTCLTNTWGTLPFPALSEGNLVQSSLQYLVVNGASSVSRLNAAANSSAVVLTNPSGVTSIRINGVDSPLNSGQLALGWFHELFIYPLSADTYRNQICDAINAAYSTKLY